MTLINNNAEKVNAHEHWCVFAHRTVQSSDNLKRSQNDIKIKRQPSYRVRKVISGLDMQDSKCICLDINVYLM